ncbi:hypothetical protein WR25_19459 [Diploscapter pachys]|uniref:K Homology domain-containing protein n=1 Tax=Diploscapter pachys TaxID=2018661 RepID=A0A2A2KLA0_9BILA|nr:hypothetical protein WR25_19459 [Diploscapter pachys]
MDDRQARPFRRATLLDDALLECPICYNEFDSDERIPLIAFCDTIEALKRMRTAVDAVEVDVEAENAQHALHVQELDVPKGLQLKITGKENELIRELERECGCRIAIPGKDDSSLTWRISGTQDGVEQATARILSSIEQEAMEEWNDEETEEVTVDCSLAKPQSKKKKLQPNRGGMRRGRGGHSSSPWGGRGRGAQGAGGYYSNAGYGAYGGGSYGASTHRGWGASAGGRGGSNRSRGFKRRGDRSGGPASKRDNGGGNFSSSVVSVPIALPTPFYPVPLFYNHPFVPSPFPW